MNTRSRDGAKHDRDRARGAAEAGHCKDGQVVATGAKGTGRWKGDGRRMGLSNDKIKKLGWAPKHTSAEAIRATAKALAMELGPVSS